MLIEISSFQRKLNNSLLYNQAEIISYQFNLLFILYSFSVSITENIRFLNLVLNNRTSFFDHCYQLCANSLFERLILEFNLILRHFFSSNQIIYVTLVKAIRIFSLKLLDHSYRLSMSVFSLFSL